MAFPILFSLRYAFLFSFYPFFYFDTDTSHGSFFLIIFFFVLVFGFVGGLVCLSTVSSSEVRIVCPSISFLFACLGGSLGVFPHLENFIF